MRKRSDWNNLPTNPPKPTLTIDIISLFPNVFLNYLNEGLMARAIARNLISVKAHNLRNWTTDSYKTADDRPYGGGAGMVIKVEPVAKALKELKKKDSYTLMLSPRGNKLNQGKSRFLANQKHIILICGHYEGVDQRIIDYYVDEELSIGDYILSGGEAAAIVVVDAVTRLVQGFLGNESSLEKESFEKKLLEFPQYTRPKEYDGHKVPEVLLKGNHEEIERWRNSKSHELTQKIRPDLLDLT
jgi:tRNA (guanine37-N1)-methyltransferase